MVAHEKYVTSFKIILFCYLWYDKRVIYYYCRNTPLIVGAVNGQTEAVKLLLQSGAEVSATGQYQETALHAAAQGGHLSTVSVLLASGADIESRSERG